MKMKAIFANLQSHFLELLLLLGLCASLISRADDNPFVIPVNYPATQIASLETYRGHYLTAIYANGSVSGLANSSDQIHLRQIQFMDENILISGDTVHLPLEKVRWTGIWKPNLLILVVHEQPHFTWKNVDGDQPTFPANAHTTTNTKAIAVSTVSVHALEALVDRQGVAQYQFNLSLPINNLQILGSP